MLSLKLLYQYLKNDATELPHGEKLIEFDRRHQRLLAGLLAFFALMLALRIHNFSIPMWHYEIDGSPQDEILMGKARGVRGDDWALDLTLVLAQLKSDPKLPIVNPNIGLGNIMMAPFPVPIWHSILLLRPTTWGFLIDADLGFTWMWWMKVLCTFYGFFLLFLILTRNQFWLSVMGSFFILYSPFMQFWSFHKGEIVFHCLFALVSVLVLLYSRSRKEIAIAAVSLGWNMASMILEHLYPPFQIVLSYFSVFCVLGLLWDRRAEFLDSGLFKMKAAGLCLAAIIVVTFGYLFYISAREAIDLITHTTYPGTRFLTGGNFPIAYFFSNQFFYVPKMKVWTPMGNICEGADFLHFFPLIFLAWVPAKILKERRIPGIAVSMTFAIGFLAFFSYVGIPHWLAKWSLLSKVTPNRTQIGIGFADAVLLICFLADRKSIIETSGKFRVVAFMLWGFILLKAGILFHGHVPEIPIYYLTIMAALNIAMGYCLLYLPGKKLWLAILCLAFYSYTRSFNPIVRGGYSFIQNSPLSMKMKEAQAQDPAYWAVFAPNSQSISNLPRMIGIPSLGGYQEHPHFKLWKAFDPVGKFAELYNQCAFVNFSGTLEKDLSFDVMSGSVTAKVSPLNPAFSSLGVKYFLVEKSQARYFSTAEFKKIATDIKYDIYKLTN